LGARRGLGAARRGAGAARGAGSGGRLAPARRAPALLLPSLAIALENARLYERQRADEQQIRDDLATAREIQAQLLPRSSPWIPGLQIGFAY
jgi:hypothetical protein